MEKITAVPEYTDEIDKLGIEPAVPEIFNERFQVLLNNDSYLKEEMETGLNDLKKSVSDGKIAVANAITAMGVSTATDATFTAMAENVEKIKPTINVGGSVNGSWDGATFIYGGGCGGSASINGKNTVPTATSFTNKSTTVGGNATTSDVLSGKTFSSNNAGREVNGTMIALRLTRLFAGNQTGYSAYEGFSQNMYATAAFSSTQSSGKMIYIRFNTSTGPHEVWCGVGLNVTSNSWKFTVSSSNIELKYVGTSSNQWIQIMAYAMTYAHSGWA